MLFALSPFSFPNIKHTYAEIYKYIFKVDSASYNQVWFSGPLFNCLNLSQILFILNESSCQVLQGVVYFIFN